MNNTKIHIDRIQINAQLISPPVAQSAVQGLGQELLAGLGQQNWSSAQSAPIRDLYLGTLAVKNPHDAGQLRQAIAQAVIQAIVTKTGIRR
jgi:hypothetical protein